MFNKRGQGLSTSAIVLIVLGVVVLAILIIGFTIGWGKLAPWISSDNTDTIVQACTAACSTGSVSAYCVTERELKSDNLFEKKSITGTCKFFATNPAFSLLGIEDCSASLCVADKCDEAGGYLVAPKDGVNECPVLGYGSQKVEGTKLEITPSPDKKICCKYELK